MHKRALSATSIVLAVFALSYPLVVSGKRAQVLAAVEPQQTQSPTPSSPRMPDMMKMHEQMMAEMKASDAKLDQLVSEMNSATGEARISAIAQVVTELARQQKTMHGRMGSMHEQMMSGRGMMMKR